MLVNLPLRTPWVRPLRFHLLQAANCDFSLLMGFLACPVEAAIDGKGLSTAILFICLYYFVFPVSLLSSLTAFVTYRSVFLMMVGFGFILFMFLLEAFSVWIL